jgi:hypothetical protein
MPRALPALVLPLATCFSPAPVLDLQSLDAPEDAVAGHEQSPAGRGLEHSLIIERVRAGVRNARGKGKRQAAGPAKSCCRRRQSCRRSGTRPIVGIDLEAARHRGGYGSRGLCHASQNAPSNPGRKPLMGNKQIGNDLKSICGQIVMQSRCYLNVRAKSLRRDDRVQV